MHTRLIPAAIMAAVLATPGTTAFAQDNADAARR